MMMIVSSMLQLLHLIINVVQKSLKECRKLNLLLINITGKK